MRTVRGFTLVELLVTVAVLSVLVTLSVPSFQNIIQKHRTIGAAEKVYAQLLYAKNESIKRSVPIRVSFTANNTTTWSFGLTDDDTSGCDSTIADKTDANACTIEYDNDPAVDSDGDGNNTDPVLIRFTSTDFPNVSMKGRAGIAPSFTGGTAEAEFEPVRGMARAGTVVLTSADHEVWIRVSLLGRVRTCSPSGAKHVPRYSSTDCS